jgi:CO/xanthine dehydrogenase Mo-binding subunit
MRGRIIGRALQRVEGAEKVSGVWLYAADNLRPGNVVGAGCCTDPITMRILNIDVSRAKNPLGPRQALGRIGTCTKR